jgi:hypothetical protein
MPVELELTSLRLDLQAEELNSTNIPQRINALLDLEEQRSYALKNLKKRQQSVKKYFDKKSKSTTFAVDEKVFFGILLMQTEVSIPNFRSFGWSLHNRLCYW